MSDSGWSPAYLPEQLQLPQLLVVVLWILPIVLQDKLEGEERDESLALSDTRRHLLSLVPRQQAAALQGSLEEGPTAGLAV